MQSCPTRCATPKQPYHKAFRAKVFPTPDMKKANFSIGGTTIQHTLTTQARLKVKSELPAKHHSADLRCIAYLVST